MGERQYEFRRRLEQVHKPDRRNRNLQPEPGETEIGDGWSIVIADNASPLVLNVAKDLQDYLLMSMNISVLLCRVEDVAQCALTGMQVIVLAEEHFLPSCWTGLVKSRSYRIVVEKNRIVIVGCDERGVGQGSYYLEDLMNLREAPYMRIQDTVREPLFSPRMVHSGWGLDAYPNSHLNAMAHAGIDAILVFVSDVDTTPEGYLDFNNVIDRAALYGIDVYMYSHLESRKHPRDEDAETYYDHTYGKVMEACPRFKGIIFVGESCEFPSKDPNTTGILRTDWPIDRVQTKPSPGWWPCADYPEWLNMLKKVIHKYNADTEIVFWTYNWGWAPEKDRLALIRNLPKDITLQVTFEMFEQIRYAGVTNVCMDYTISFEGPGKYFLSEAQAAHEQGIKLYTMSNTGGLTWDIGVIPYVPVPYQWSKRQAALLAARADWGLSGLMESHHFGWWPSFISDIAKWAYWSPSPNVEDIFAAIARRDFSAEAVPLVLEAWRCWSEGIRCYIPTGEDQYGPFRIGPSYPLVFIKKVQIPDKAHSLFGNKIVDTHYGPYEDHRQSLGIHRIDSELERLGRMATLWQQGIDKMSQALAITPQCKQEEGRLLLGLNQFILHTVQTTIHVKKWWKLKQALFNESSVKNAVKLLAQLETIALAEIANAEAAIPLVEHDSRLGWEPSMDYMTDPAHLCWKIEQVRSMLVSELSDYRQSLSVTDQELL